MGGGRRAPIFRAAAFKTSARHRGLVKRKIKSDNYEEEKFLNAENILTIIFVPGCFKRFIHGNRDFSGQSLLWFHS